VDRAGPKAKLPVPFLHEPQLFTTPVGVAAKLCTGAAAEDGLGGAFCRRRCITVETVSAVVAVVAVKVGVLLLAMERVVGGIKIQHDLGAAPRDGFDAPL
jgi:hypothetical protein